MNKLNQWIVLSVGIGALTLAILIGSTPTVSAAPGASDVRVVNTPLPVMGTVTASQAAGTTYSVTIAPHPMFRVFLGTIGGFDPSWTNNSSMVAVVTNVSGESVDDDHVIINVFDGGGSFESHSYLFPGTKAAASNDYYFNAQTLAYVPPGATLSLSGVAVMEFSGHFEAATAPVVP